MDRLPFNPYDFFGYLASGLLLVVGMQFVLGFPQIIGHNFGVVDGAILVLAIYVAGQLTASPAKTLLEDGIVEKMLVRPSVVLLRRSKPLVRGLIFPGFYKPLPESLRARVLEKAKSEGINETGEALFLHVRFSAKIRNDEKLAARLEGFINQYGFSRNLAFTAVVVGIAVIVKAKIAIQPELIKYGVTSIVIGVLLFYRFLKFFRQYSFELFNTYISY